MVGISSNRCEALRAAIGGDSAPIAIGAYDAISARLIQEAGFPIVYVGSYATAAARFGLPDVGLLSLREMVECAGDIVNAVTVPVVADAENGYNNAANIWRTVRMFEQAGVSAIHIEDHEFGKHAMVEQVLLPLPQMVEKIRAAVEAREEMLIIARTDAKWVSGNLDEAIARANKFIEAGADLIMMPGLSPVELNSVRGRLTGKVVLLHAPGYSFEDERRSGACAIIYYSFTLFTAYRGVKEALSLLKRNGAADQPVSDSEFEQFIGVDDFVLRAKKYDLGQKAGER